MFLRTIHFPFYLQAIAETSNDLLEEIHTHEKIRARKRNQKSRDEEKSFFVAPWFSESDWITTLIVCVITEWAETTLLRLWRPAGKTARGARVDCKWSLILAIPAKYTCARENGLPRRNAEKHFRARACISPESPKLETTRSLPKGFWDCFGRLWNCEHEGGKWVFFWPVNWHLYLVSNAKWLFFFLVGRDLSNNRTRFAINFIRERIAFLICFSRWFYNVFS